MKNKDIYQVIKRVDDSSSNKAIIIIKDKRDGLLYVEEHQSKDITKTTNTQMLNGHVDVMFLGHLPILQSDISNITPESVSTLRSLLSVHLRQQYLNTL